MIPKTIIHILSGGMDSTVMLYDLQAQGHRVHCVLFDYKQKHVQELIWAKHHCHRLTAGERRLGKGKRRPESLRFERVVVDLDHFEDDLAEAKAARGLNEKTKHEQKASVFPAKSEMLRATGRQVEVPDNIKSAAQILNRTVPELVAAMRDAI